LARLVISFLDTPSKAARIKIEGPDFVEKKFGLARMLDETLTLYRSTTPAEKA
jgi:hypothetical protein